MPSSRSYEQYDPDGDEESRAVAALVRERMRSDVTRLLGAGFNFDTRRDYDLALEWAQRAYAAGRSEHKGKSNA